MLQFYSPPKEANIWFTSDIHGFHKNICRGTTQWDGAEGCRDFDTPEEMTELIVANINECVAPDDILISLGDWAFAGRPNIARLRKMIECETVVHLIGNHDHHIQRHLSEQAMFYWIGHYNEFRYRGTKFVMSHYPMDSWNEIGRGAIMLHGHCHGTLKNKLPRRLDVGVDCHSFLPLHIDDIMRKLKDDGIADVDHHNDKTQYGK